MQVALAHILAAPCFAGGNIAGMEELRMASKNETVWVRATLALRIIKAGVDKGFWLGAGAGAGFVLGVCVIVAVAQVIEWAWGLVS